MEYWKNGALPKLLKMELCEMKVSNEKQNLLNKTSPRCITCVWFIISFVELNRLNDSNDSSMSTSKLF